MNPAPINAKRGIVRPPPSMRRRATDPGAVVGVRRRGGLDELDTDQAVDAGGDGQLAAGRRRAVAAGAQQSARSA